MKADSFVTCVSQLKDETEEKTKKGQIMVKQVGCEPSDTGNILTKGNNRDFLPDPVSFFLLFTLNS